MSGIFVAAARHQDCAIPYLRSRAVAENLRIDLSWEQEQVRTESMQLFTKFRDGLKYTLTQLSTRTRGFFFFFFFLRNTSKKLGSLALPSFAQNLDFWSRAAASRHEIDITPVYQKPGNYSFFGVYRSGSKVCRHLGYTSLEDHWLFKCP